jgi:AraC-like DNA-binding protein
MPDLDGISLCRQIKNDERTSHIPVILLTAKAASDDKIAGLQSGADDYIIKPFNMDELGTRISNLLAIREKLRLKYDRIHIMDSGKWIPESVDDKFMERILKIINSNLRDHNFDVGWLQEHIGMSKTHLTRKLKILTGLSPGTLIRNIRLEKAAELLKNNKGNITEIANIVGVSNPSNFTKSFRKYFGVSPKEYSKHKNTIHPQVSNEWS